MNHPAGLLTKREYQFRVHVLLALEVQQLVVVVPVALVVAFGVLAMDCSV